MKKYMFLAALVVLTLAVGCRATTSGTGGALGEEPIAYNYGKLSAVENAAFTETWNATLATLKDAKYPISEIKKETHNGTITAMAEGDKKVKLNIEGIGSDKTRLQIRVGVLGDEDLSRTIHQNIREKLGYAAGGR